MSHLASSSYDTSSIVLPFLVEDRGLLTWMAYTWTTVPPGPKDTIGLEVTPCQLIGTIGELLC